MMLADKYRPRSLAQLVGQPKIVRTLELFQSRGGLAGRAYWITGKTGMGKTTIAKIIADAVADDCFQIEIAADELTADCLRSFERMSWLSATGKGGRAFIINEAHGLSARVVRALKDTLDNGRIPKHVVWIFTTTNDEQDRLFEGAEEPLPLIHRCTRLELTNQGLREPAAAFLQSVALAEGLDGQPIEAYQRLWKEHPSFRDALECIERGEMLR